MCGWHTPILGLVDGGPMPPNAGRDGNGPRPLAPWAAARGSGRDRPGTGGDRADAGSSEPVVLRGPKFPTWGCACGTDGNWASRVVCRGCRRQAPTRILAAAWCAHGMHEAGKGAAANRQVQQQQLPRTDHKAHATAAAPTVPAPARRSRAVEAHEAEEAGWKVVRRRRARRQAPADDEKEHDGDAEVDEEEKQWSLQLRYWRERRGAAQRAGVAADVAVCDGEIEGLLAKFKANRPWPARVQAADAAQAKAAAKLLAAQEAVAAAKAKLEKLEATLVEAEEEATAAAKEVEALRLEAARQVPAKVPAEKEPGPAQEVQLQALDTLRRAAAQTGESLEVLLARLCAGGASSQQQHADSPGAMEVDHRKRKEPDDEAASEASGRARRK